jgi:hypothetical protein
VDGTSRVCLSPPESDTLRAGDALIVFARSGREAAARASAPPPSPVPMPAPAAAARATAAAPASHTVIAGLERTGMEGELLSTLAELAADSGARGATVSVLSATLSPGDVSRYSSRACKFTLVRGSAFKRADLRAAGAARADHVLLLQPPAGAGGASDAQRDVKVVAALLHLEQMAMAPTPGAPGPRHVLASVQGANAALLAQRAAPGLRLDLLDLHRLTAGALAGAVADPLTPAVAAMLLNTGGCELYIKPAEAYLPPVELKPGAAPLTGWDVAAAARAKGDVFVGYVPAGQRDVVMAPRRDAARAWAHGDALVVVSERM